MAGIPFGKAVNPITKTNWEWVGITPYIETSTENAFDTAYHSALNKLLKVTQSESQKIDIDNKLKVLTLPLKH